MLNAFSRKREYRADAIASILVGKQAMISALNSLSLDTEAPAKSQMSYNAMKISTPQAFIEWFSTHPVIERRTQALEFETYSRLANEKNTPPSRTTASILGILLCFVGGHHFYMRRAVWILPNLLMSVFSLPVVLAEVYTYWTQADSDEEFEEKFVKQDGAKKTRLIALAIVIPIALLYVNMTKDSTDIDKEVKVINTVPQTIQVPAPETAVTSDGINNSTATGLSRYVGKFPTEILNDPLIKINLKPYWVVSLIILCRIWG